MALAAEILQEQQAAGRPGPPAGFVRLLGLLFSRYGTEAVTMAEPILTNDVGITPIELRVPVEQVDEASQFVTSVASEIETNFNEVYPVVVLPTEA